MCEKMLFFRYACISGYSTDVDQWKTLPLFKHTLNKLVSEDAGWLRGLTLMGKDKSESRGCKVGLDFFLPPFLLSIETLMNISSA